MLETRPGFSLDPSLQPNPETFQPTFDGEPRQEHSRRWPIAVGIVAMLAVAGGLKYGTMINDEQSFAANNTSAAGPAASAPLRPGEPATITKERTVADDPVLQPVPDVSAARAPASQQKPGKPVMYIKPFTPSANWQKMEFTPTRDLSKQAPDPWYTWSTRGNNANAISMIPKRTVYNSEGIVGGAILECLGTTLVTTTPGNKIDQKFSGVDSAACADGELEKTDGPLLPGPKKILKLQ